MRAIVTTVLLSLVLVTASVAPAQAAPAYCDKKYDDCRKGGGSEQVCEAVRDACKIRDLELRWMWQEMTTVEFPCNNHDKAFWGDLCWIFSGEAVR